MKATLDALAAAYNTPAFVADDPVQFPRRYSGQADIEISSLVTSTISWGRRAMILRNAERIDAIMEHDPHRFVLEGDIDAIPDGNLHRTFFAANLRWLLRGLRELYRRYPTMEAFSIDCGAVGDCDAPWRLAARLNALFADANAATPLAGPTRCLPEKVADSALKRFNMALRWLVRRDGIVDIGCWQKWDPSHLSIPLDVHSGNTARALGLLARRANDRRAVDELTEALRTLDPSDPVRYDFALFGYGVNNSADAVLQ